MKDTELLILGANGQLGRALQDKYPNARTADISTLDITNRTSVEDYDWSGVHCILNAAAYTNVDGAETQEGRLAAWAVNADAVANLVAVAAQHNALLVHISTDYVFDGKLEVHNEQEDFAPLSVYGSSKAAGDTAVSLAPKYYIIRTSWVVGGGKNFVRSMLVLAKRKISPKVVCDQYGRLTFTSELVRAIDFLITENAPYGTYNVSNGGDVVSWAEIARQIYKYAEADDLIVADTPAAEYFAGKLSANRPIYSGLDMEKIRGLGFESRDWRVDLKIYIEKEKGS